MFNKRFALTTTVILLLAILTSAAFAAEPAGTTKTLNDWFGIINGYLGSVFFFDIFWFTDKLNFPFLVAWLIVGAVFLTIKMGFINLRVFRHAYRIIRGKYNKGDEAGEVTPFQALTTALSATVGLGNIAGVAIAVSIGGPGAVFWMIIAGLLGMTAKFTEATLAQMYREVRSDGKIMGGAMEYLSRGFSERGFAGIGKALAILFCVLCIGASLGGGNAFQVSQALGAVGTSIHTGFYPELSDADFKGMVFEPYRIYFGIFMAILVAIVIIGGVKRIAHTAEAVVPTMVVIYLTACIWIIGSHASEVPAALKMIVVQAFSPEAAFGGVIGAIVQGFKRAAFSSEAGIGSAAIAHSAAKTQYPVRQGIVALLEPFIDTVVICTMTALVIILTGVYEAPAYEQMRAAKEGAALTSEAFRSVISWFPYILSVSVVLFAFSTMISWSYYGERCWTYMFGDKSSMAYKIMFVLFVVIGSVTSATNILDFSDLLLLSMAFPNLIGLYLLSGKVKSALTDYMARLKSGELDREVGRGR